MSSECFLPYFTKPKFLKQINARWKLQTLSRHQVMETSLQSRIGTPCILITSTVHRNSADVNVYSNPESFRRMPLLSSEGCLEVLWLVWAGPTFDPSLSDSKTLPINQNSPKKTIWCWFCCEVCSMRAKILVFLFTDIYHVKQYVAHSKCSIKTSSNGFRFSILCTPGFPWSEGKG